MEDEFHFLMICKEYQTERIEFCRKRNQVIVPFESFTSREKIIFLMSTNDTEVLILLVYKGTTLSKLCAREYFPMWCPGLGMVLDCFDS